MTTLKATGCVSVLVRICTSNFQAPKTIYRPWSTCKKSLWHQWEFCCISKVVRSPHRTNGSFAIIYTGSRYSPTNCTNMYSNFIIIFWFLSRVFHWCASPLHAPCFIAIGVKAIPRILWWHSFTKEGNFPFWRRFTWLFTTIPQITEQTPLQGKPIRRLPVQ